MKGIRRRSLDSISLHLTNSRSSFIGSRTQSFSQSSTSSTTVDSVGALSSLSLKSNLLPHCIAMNL